MTKICYTPRTFNGKRMDLIDKANKIVAEYEAMDLSLTLRQLYYQFVARDYIPNTFRSYKNLQSVINDARLAGLISWYAIEDRTRNMIQPPSWDDPADIVAASARSFRVDPWEDQSCHVEVWVEKDALLAVVERGCEKWRTPYFSCRGYVSQSEVWASAMRLQRLDKPVTILHLGDHDPSGVDMSRDIQSRMELFGADNVHVDRIALTMTQVRALNPPPNPVKVTDSRSPAYTERYGHESWELDALSPPYLVDLIQSHTEKCVDPVKWAASMETEKRARAELRAVSERYDEVQEFLNKYTEDENE